MRKYFIPDHLKRRIAELPEAPGVYFFKDKSGKAIYIGKAVSIRKRVSSHFRSHGEGVSKQSKMLSEIRRIDYLGTVSEAEALLLEAGLVRENMPKYNQLLKDDKSYPFLKISAEEFPRLLIVRARKADGSKYFGPYTNVHLLRQAVGFLKRLFPLRTCHPMPDKVCLMYHIGQCKGPCIQEINKEEYAKIVKELELFLGGRRDALVRNLMRQMKEYSAKREFENAQSTYDTVRALSVAVGPSRAFAGGIGQVLNDLAQILSLSKPPIHIEGFDISNLFGQEAVGSMVYFSNGSPARSQYRRFRVKTVSGINDYNMMREVVSRRYTRVLAEGLPLPDLVVIDGGKGHLAAAKEELDALNLSHVPIIGIAKQHEHLFLPGRPAPIILSLSSPVLDLVRNLRDEAHRFAVAYHRRLHRKEELVSQLDNIPGLGPKAKTRLLRTFGSVKKIRTLSETSLVEKGGLNPKLAHVLRATLSTRIP